MDAARCDSSEIPLQIYKKQQQQQQQQGRGMVMYMVAA
jgi:hypothetical protein